MGILVKVPSYDELLDLGIREREKGDVNKAIKCFKKILSLYVVQSPSRKVEIKNHLGLAYYHKKSYEKAKETWEEARKLAVETNNISGLATALRNLSRKELYLSGSDLVKALGYAEEAVGMAESLNRNDLVWFLHGLFSATEVLGEKDKLKPILKREIRALFKVWSKIPKLERNVWLDGVLMDYVIVHNKIGKPLLYLARYLARKQGLKRREEQINNLLVLI